MKFTFRIFLLFALIGMIASFPFVRSYHINASRSFDEVSEAIPLNPSSDLPAVGNSFHIAGQDPEPTPAADLKLRAPDVSEVGELVRLDARESTVDGIIWQILPFSEDFEVIENGRRAFFTSRVPGTYLFVIAGAKDGQAYLIHHTIIVDGGVDTGEVTLSSKIRAWLSKVPDYEGKAAKAKAISGVFRKLATDEGVDVKELLQATATANAAVLGGDLEKWIPFLEALGAELDIYVENDQLGTREQYKEIWLLISNGIDRVFPPTAGGNPIE